MTRSAHLATSILVVVAGVVGCSTATTDDGATAPGIAGDDAAAPDASVDAPPKAKGCTKASDCPSKICSAEGTCKPAACDDGAQNGTETDVDCGGDTCKSCDVSQRCAVGRDCVSGSCQDAGQGLRCQPPACDDGVKNGDETDVDCGGPTCKKCAPARACKVRSDCVYDVCTGSVCVLPACNDGLIDGTKTDIDCGGLECPRCIDGRMCKTGADCASGVCKDVGAGLKCQPPACDDHVKNGLETDVDCGGPTCAKCATGKTCLAHADCASDGCGYAKQCVAVRSCTAHNGGDTCGSGGAGGVGAASWESCCTTVAAGAVKFGKYQVTSGRMRAFLERTNGDVRSFIQSARAAGQLHGATLDASWDAYLPTSLVGCDNLGNCGAGELSDHEFNQPVSSSYVGIYTSALRHIGGTMFDGQNLGQQGCRIDAPGTHSYWMSDKMQSDLFGDKPAEQPQSVYDTKPLNCVDYLMAQSFCVWDGGRLETQAEYQAAGGPTPNTGAVPWGAPVPWGPGSSTFGACRFPSATDAMLRGLPPASACSAFVPPAGRSIEWADYFYSYEYPSLGTWDFIVFLSAPGRLAARTNGVSDLVGPIMEITSDANNVNPSPKTTLTRWTANGSWEGHGWGYYGWNFSLVNKYGKQGLRCVYP